MSASAGQIRTSHSRAYCGIAALALLLAGLWCFPKIWYRKADPKADFVWFTEQTQLPGWSYKEASLDSAAERVLVADRLVNGEFTGPAGQKIRVFSAKRYEEKPNEMGLFVHTPDRCWAQAGWKLETALPDSIEMVVHGVKLQLERRVFSGGDAKELVYFGGLVGGRPLPYRLDHNLGTAYRLALKRASAASGTTLTNTETHLWQRVWQSFVTRQPLLGPKQFVRLSTTMPGDDPANSDALLKQMLESWLLPGDYQEERLAWKRDAASGRHTAPKSGHE